MQNLLERQNLFKVEKACGLRSQSKAQLHTVVSRVRTVWYFDRCGKSIMSAFSFSKPHHFAGEEVTHERSIYVSPEGYLSLM